VGAIESGWPFKPGGTPAVAAIYVDLRVPPHIEASGPIAELGDVAARGAASAGSFQVELLPFATHLPGALVPADHPLVVAAASAVPRATAGPPPDPTDDDFPPGDDGKLFAAAGIPYVKLGPGSPADRDPRFGREQVRVEQLRNAARAYVVLAARLAALDPADSRSWPPVLTRPGQFEPVRRV
jgi:acetylornithine deacetylase/succinyl-diaminopimelate desuccinylase-like protein